MSDYDKALFDIPIKNLKGYGESLKVRDNLEVICSLPYEDVFLALSERYLLLFDILDTPIDCPRLTVLINNSHKPSHSNNTFIPVHRDDVCASDFYKNVKKVEILIHAKLKDKLF